MSNPVPKFEIGSRVGVTHYSFKSGGDGRVSEINITVAGVRYLIRGVLGWRDERDLHQLPDTIQVELNVADVDRFLDDWRNNKRYILPDSTTEYLFNVYGAFERAFDARSQ